MTSEPLVHVRRGRIVEAAHYGDIVAVDGRGDVVFSRGDPERLIYFRSAAKPLQAVAAMLTGVDSHHGLSVDEIAFIASSHSGEAVHIELARRVLGKFSLREDHLCCPPARPMNQRAAEEMLRSRAAFGRVHHNCSGKHMAMLAQCRIRGWPLEGYYRPDHPVQRWVTEVIARFCGVRTEDLVIGCDGCGVPVHGVPLRRMALAFQRLASSAFEEGEWAEACAKVSSAMMTFPYIIAGEGRFDYQLMEACTREVVAKTGAEGLFCFGMPDRPIGVAVKIGDGSQRGMETVVARVAEILSLMSPAAASRLAAFATVPLTNARGEVVGSISPAF